MPSLGEYSRFYFEERTLLRFIIDELDAKIKEELQPELKAWADGKVVGQDYHSVEFTDNRWAVVVRNPAWACADDSTAHCAILLAGDLQDGELVGLWFGTEDGGNSQAAGQVRALSREHLPSWPNPRGRATKVFVGRPWSGPAAQPLSEFLDDLFLELRGLASGVSTNWGAAAM